MTFRKNLIFGSILAGAFCYSTAASAQATRTWVSGVGDDANPCSRTAPCKTFAGAISKTATGGEINCLDPGGFGGVTITKSISIVCDYTEGGILSAGAGVNGIIVNAPATHTVFLSGLDLNGAGNAQNGIRILAAAHVMIQNSIIRNYRASNGLGISFQPSGNTQLVVQNTTINDNGTAATGGGMLIQPTGAAGTSRVFMREVRFNGNANNALRVDSTSNTGPSSLVYIENSNFTGSVNGINVIAPPGNALMSVQLVNSVLANNSGTGFISNGSGALAQVANTSIYSNTTGVSAVSSGTLNTFGDNRVFLNGAPGSFTGLALPKS